MRTASFPLLPLAGEGGAKRRMRVFVNGSRVLKDTPSPAFRAPSPANGRGEIICGRERGNNAGRGCCSLSLEQPALADMHVGQDALLLDEAPGEEPPGIAQFGVAVLRLAGEIDELVRIAGDLRRVPGVLI